MLNRISIKLVVVLVVALVVVQMAGAERVGVPTCRENTSLAVDVALIKQEANGRLASIGGVFWKVAEPNMHAAVFVVGGPPFGSTLAYGKVPDAPPPTLTPKPKLLPNPTDLQRRIYKAELKAWNNKNGPALAEWKADRAKAAEAWALERARNLKAAKVRSHEPITTQDMAISLFRAGRFFHQVKATRPVLLIIIGRLPTPPDLTLDYGLHGARVVLAGLKTDKPHEYEQAVASWKAFLVNHGVNDKVVALPLGLDRSNDIAAAVCAAGTSNTRQGGSGTR